MSDTDNTVGNIINDAMFNAGLIALGDSISSNTAAQTQYMRQLRDLVRYEQTQGLKLFLNQDLSITPVQGTQTYTLTSGSDKPLRVISAYYQDSSNVRRPLVPLSRDEWTRLAQPLNQGAPNSYFVDKQAYSLLVSFWLIPDAVTATGTFHCVTQVAVTAQTTFDFTTNTAFPDEWRMYLVWGLADQICTGQPQAIMDKCAMNAEKYRAALEDWDVEDAPTMFQPDSRMQYSGSSFK